MALSNEQWNAPSGGGDPTPISQTDFESFTENGTWSTFTYDDATYGNYLVLAGHNGQNTFLEHNTVKPNGFTGHSYIQWQINGYAWAFFTTFTGTSTTENYFEGQGGRTATTKTAPTPMARGYTYFDGGNNATSGNVSISPRWNSTNGSTLTVPGVTAKYWGDDNPTTFRTGVDDDGRWYIEVYHSGGKTIGEPDFEGTGWSKVGPYYIIQSSGNLTTDGSGDSGAVGIINTSNGYQWGWGNYDGGGVENMRRLVIATNGS